MAQKLYEEENIRAIAKAIRSGFQSSTETYTTAQMPAGIIAMYNEGVNRGYDEGYFDGKSEGGGGDNALKAYIPIIIQDGAIEITAPSYGDLLVYSASDFEYATVENTIYNWKDEITVTASQKSSGTTKKYFTITVTNKNPILYVKVCLLAYTAAGNALGTSLTQYFTVNVPPSSSTSVNTGTVTGTISSASSYRTVQFLKWSTIA